jgi:hypothetical protein
MLWRVVWSGDRSRRVIFAEELWAAVEDDAAATAEPEELRSAIEVMGESILRLSPSTGSTSSK